MTKKPARGGHSQAFAFAVRADFAQCRCAQHHVVATGLGRPDRYIPFHVAQQVAYRAYQVALAPFPDSGHSQQRKQTLAAAAGRSAYLVEAV